MANTRTNCQRGSLYLESRMVRVKQRRYLKMAVESCNFRNSSSLCLKRARAKRNMICGGKKMIKGVKSASRTARHTSSIWHARPHYQTENMPLLDVRVGTTVFRLSMQHSVFRCSVIYWLQLTRVELKFDCHHRPWNDKYMITDHRTDCLWKWSLVGMNAESYRPTLQALQKLLFFPWLCWFQPQEAAVSHVKSLTLYTTCPATKQADGQS